MPLPLMGHSPSVYIEIKLTLNMARLGPGTPTAQSSHTDQPTVLSHIRRGVEYELQVLIFYRVYFVSEAVGWMVNIDYALTMMIIVCTV